MSIAAPPCMCWQGGNCPRHGVEPREYHECKDGGFRAGAQEHCLPCATATMDAYAADAKTRGGAQDA